MNEAQSYLQRENNNPNLTGQSRGVAGIVTISHLRHNSCWIKDSSFPPSTSLLGGLSLPPPSTSWMSSVLFHSGLRASESAQVYSLTYMETENCWLAETESESPMIPWQVGVGRRQGGKGAHRGGVRLQQCRLPCSAMQTHQTMRREFRRKQIGSHILDFPPQPSL